MNALSSGSYWDGKKGKNLPTPSFNGKEGLSNVNDISQIAYGITRSFKQIETTQL